MTAPELQYKVESDADGTVTVRFEQGERFALTAAGICADLTSITAVGIKHVDEVASHIINTIAGSRSHVDSFHQWLTVELRVQQRRTPHRIVRAKSRMPHIARQRIVILYFLRDFRCAKSSA